MRVCLILSFMLASFTFAVEPDAKKALEPLQGKWKIIKVVYGDKEEAGEKLKKNSVKVDGDKLHIEFSEEFVFDFKITVRPDKKPAEIDGAILGVLSSKSLNGIYKIEDGKLTILFADSRESIRPENFDPKKSKDTPLMFVLEKAK